MNKIKTYEIWIGRYSSEQEDHPLAYPAKIDEVRATSFRIACLIHEHQWAIDELKEQMNKENSHIEGIHFGQWYYDPKTNSNSWTGKYYESRKEALKSFKI